MSAVSVIYRVFKQTCATRPQKVRIANGHARGGMFDTESKERIVLGSTVQSAVNTTLLNAFSIGLMGLFIWRQNKDTLKLINFVGDVSASAHELIRTARADVAQLRARVADIQNDTNDDIDRLQGDIAGLRLQAALLNVRRRRNRPLAIPMHGDQQMDWLHPNHPFDRPPVHLRELHTHRRQNRNEHFQIENR